MMVRLDLGKPFALITKPIVIILDESLKEPEVDYPNTVFSKLIIFLLSSVL